MWVGDAVTLVWTRQAETLTGTGSLQLDSGENFAKFCQVGPSIPTQVFLNLQVRTRKRPQHKQMGGRWARTRTSRTTFQLLQRLILRNRARTKQHLNMENFPTFQSLT